MVGISRCESSKSIYLNDTIVMSKVDVQKLESQLFEAEIVFSWNKKLFTLFGLNPLNFNNIVYFTIFTYSVMHFILSCAALPQNLSNMNNMVDAITEVGSMITVLTKFSLYQIKRNSIAKLLNEIESDYSIKKYKNQVDVSLFINYVFRAKTFFKVAIPVSFASSILYFLRPFTVGGIGIPMSTDAGNKTTFILPYRMRFYFPLTDFNTYLCALLYLLPVIPITSFTLVADASLMLALVAHICGQLSILSNSVLTHFADDATKFRLHAKRVIIEHHRLIGMAKRLDSVFNLLMLQQILSVTFFLCFVGYSTLMNWSQRENTQMLTFLTCAAGTIFLLFAYCFAGQCLVDESLYLCDALYHTTWYNNLAPCDLKYYLILMNRSRTPLVITGSGFYVYTLKSFLIVVKSAMAYLSVLRTLI